MLRNSSLTNNIANVGAGTATNNVFAGFVPPGSPWLNDTISGFDYYSKGFNVDPTIFYDPTASTSLNRGTFQNPYNTVAAVQARCLGNMAGQTLGVKRGTKSGVLTISGVYGSSAGFFNIVPYGNAQAMPLFSGETIQTSWTSYQTTPRQIWTQTVASKGDIYEIVNGVYNRLWAVTAANASAVATALGSYAAAPIAGTIGAFGYVSGTTTCYLYLIDGSNPNLGQIASADAAHALYVKFSDVANTGYINIVGIGAMMTYDNVFDIHPNNLSGTNAATALQVVGCQAYHGGSQELSRSPGGYGMDAFLSYGLINTASGTINQNGYWAGNYAFDVLNNAYEVDAANNFTFEHNLSYNAGGNSILEMYQLNTNHTVRLNRGYTDILTSQRIGNATSGYHRSGVWANNFDGNASANNAINGGHNVYLNYIQDFTNRGVDNVGGQNNNYYCNTLIQVNTTTTTNIGIGGGFSGGSTSTGHVWKNNLVINNCLTTASYQVFMRVNPSSDSTPMPTADYNEYRNFSNSTFGNWEWDYTGTAYSSMTNWRTATGQEAHSLSTDQTNNSSLHFTQTQNTSPVLPANTDYVITSSSDAYQAGVSIATFGVTADDEGHAFTNTTPNIGNYQGSGN